MFDRGSETYKTDLKFGETYRCKSTGYEGVATAIYFYEHACERVSLRRLNPHNQQLEDEVFDAPGVEHIKSGKTPVVEKTGGPGDGRGSRPAPARR